MPLMRSGETAGSPWDYRRVPGYRFADELISRLFGAGRPATYWARSNDGQVDSIRTPLSYNPRLSGDDLKDPDARHTDIHSPNPACDRNSNRRRRPAP